MKTIRLIVLFIICHCSVSKAQYFEWANSIQKYTGHGRTVTDFKLDNGENPLLLALDLGCFVGCNSFSINKYNANGDSIWEFRLSLLNAGFAAMAIDRNNNTFLVGRNYGVSGNTINGVSFAPSDGFLVKVDSNGVIKWAKNLGNMLTGFADLVCDNIGNVYLTKGNLTEKRNYKGDSLWSNPTIGGNTICSDVNNKIYVMNENTITKLNNNNGAVVWSKNSYNGKRLALKSNGVPFILNSDSLIKLNTSGNLMWIKPGIHGNDLAIDSIGRIVVADSNSIYRLNSTGSSQQWVLSGTNTIFQKVVLNKKGDVYSAGGRDHYNESILCPFSLKVNAYYQGASADNPFVTKINTSNPIPFQAGIFTDKLPACGNSPYNYLCTGKYYSIGFSYCTNSVSNLGPGNQFLVELLGGPVSPLIMGTAGSYMIPKSIPKGNTYQLRVSSTNPAIAGYPNLPDYYGSDITINPTIASVSALGSTTFCVGNSVQLKAATQPEYEYAWLRNDTLIYPQGLDSIITAGIDGIYKLITIDKWCSCTDTASITIHVIQPPAATITASGPLSFCAGDSVILTANSGTGLTYQWKVNNVNIPFAFYQSYKATQAGTYKVKVANSNGCTKISAGKTVAIVCRDGIEYAENSNINVYPNPFESTFNLSFDEDQDFPVEINIYDLAGRLCDSRWVKGNEGNEIELGAGLEKGFYLVEISNVNKPGRVKILKE